MALPVLQAYMECMQSVGPRRSGEVLCGLLYGGFVYVNRVNMRFGKPLGEHESHQTATCTNIQNAECRRLNADCRLRPRSEQNTISSYFHGAPVMSHKELLELKTQVHLRLDDLRCTIGSFDQFRMVVTTVVIVFVVFYHAMDCQIDA